MILYKVLLYLNKKSYIDNTCGNTELEVNTHDDILFHSVPIVENNDNRIVLLYGYSGCKNTIERFTLTHNMEIFIVTKEKIDKEEYIKLVEKYSYFELQKRVLGSVEIITTMHEIETLFDSYANAVETMMQEKAFTNPHIFKGDIYNALDVLLYTLFYAQKAEDETVLYNYYGFGLTPMGARINFEPNWLNLYVHIFKALLS